MNEAEENGAEEKGKIEGLEGKEPSSVTSRPNQISHPAKHAVEAQLESAEVLRLHVDSGRENGKDVVPQSSPPGGPRERDCKSVEDRGEAGRDGVGGVGSSKRVRNASAMSRVEARSRWEAAQMAGPILVPQRLVNERKLTLMLFCLPECLPARMHFRYLCSRVAIFSTVFSILIFHF